MAATIEETLFPRLQRVDGKPKLTLSAVLIESRLYESPLGSVYLGRHQGLHVPVVVRVMHPRVRSLLKDYNKFLEESRRLSTLRHPNIVGLLDVGEYEDHHYLVMEYAEGVPLMERIKDRPLSEAQALGLLLPIAEGLAELWKCGFVHRGVSPGIIFIGRDGAAKLDLTPLRRNYTDPQFKAYLSPNLAPYWSPEEIRNQPVDPSSDMWSFGATLYHAVTGKTPLPLGEGMGHASAMLGDPVPPRKVNPALHDGMEQVLLKLLSKNFEDRFLSAEAFLTALRSIQTQISGTGIHEPTIMMADVNKPDGSHKKLAPELGLADVVGNCKIVKKLGAGAFGVVYLARHKVLDLDVAIKILPLESAYRDPSFVEMFLREARTAARIRHRNVIGIFEAGVQNGQHYIIMELAPGGTVLERMMLYGGKLAPSMAQRILLEAARGLAAAAQLNIIHRDIKPDNLMFSADGEVKIADLGLAKRLIPSNVTETIRASLAADQLSMRNEPGMLAGTPAYMAPEIAADPEHVDTRADLYSLGVTGFHMLTGKLPFDGKSPMEVIMKHVLDDRVAPHEIEPSVPQDLSAIILKLMQKRPEHRYQTAVELVKALEFLSVSEGLMSTF